MKLCTFGLIEPAMYDDVLEAVQIIRDTLGGGQYHQKTEGGWRGFADLAHDICLNSKISSPIFSFGLVFKGY
jgi:hypothetical protein